MLPRLHSHSIQTRLMCASKHSIVIYFIENKQTLYLCLLCSEFRKQSWQRTHVASVAHSLNSSGEYLPMTPEIPARIRRLSESEHSSTCLPTSNDRVSNIESSNFCQTLNRWISFFIPAVFILAQGCGEWIEQGIIWKEEIDYRHNRMQLTYLFLIKQCLPGILILDIKAFYWLSHPVFIQNLRY